MRVTAGSAVTPEVSAARGTPGATGPARTYWAEHAWLGGSQAHIASGVTVDTDLSTGRITHVRSGVSAPPPGAEVLRGLTVPGPANAHSHAFHRALRGTAQSPEAVRGGGPRTGPPTAVTGTGTFWTWREVMYRVADALTPDSYFDLARATYAEMALAGITAVGEFHYLHHGPGGARYQDPNAMGQALIAAAAEAGIRITLLDTCYLTSAIGDQDGGPAPAPDPHQLRFSDGTADAWAERAAALKPDPAHAATTRIGAAVHSVRAVPADRLATVARWARDREAPLHVHLSEQPAENDACHAVHGRSPTRLLADHGVLGPRTTAVHATHLDPEDIALLGGTGTGVCVCPTTERDLADGIGPAARLHRAGVPLSLGSDSHAVIDLLEEARALELDERLITGTRGHWTAPELLRAATEHGHAALGRPDAGRIEAGALADFTTIALDSVRTAGPSPRLAAETAVFAATGADVRHTVVGGRQIVRDGAHQLVADVPGALAAAVSEVFSVCG